MTDASPTSTALIVPGSGRVIDLDNPDECAATLAWLKDVRAQIGDAEADLRAAMLRHAAREGVKTKMSLPSSEVTFAFPTTLDWDMPVLRELKAAGLPDHRWKELVTTTHHHKVSATVAKQIEESGNPAYAEIVGRARIRKSKPPTVAVTMRPPS